jgi:hypothetical protein
VCKKSVLAFLKENKALALICLALFLGASILPIRAYLFLSNKCPGCGELLLFYKPRGYYDPLYKETFFIGRGNVSFSFSFSIDKYGVYFIRLENENKKEGAFHLSKDIGYNFFCESVKLKSTPAKSLGYKKIFFEESKLLQMDALNDLDKEKRRKWFISPESATIGEIVAFDIGAWSPGGFADDIGRQYNCTVEFFMDEADFFEADLVVKRISPH